MAKKQGGQAGRQRPVKAACAWLRRSVPPLGLCLFGAAVFSALSIVSVATDFFSAFPEAVHFAVHACAAVFLCLAVWSLTVYLRRHSLKRLFLSTAEKNALSAKLVNDYSYRTMMGASCSLVLNSVLTLCKLVTGWFYASTWLMVLSGYYVVLIITKFILIGYGRAQSRITDKTAQRVHEWKAYRLCGVMLLVLTLFLQGVVIMIVKDGQGFFYDEIIVIAIAAYDFYCLGSAVYYMAAQHKKHTPLVNAVKVISLASSLVAILSLQTAMLASYGQSDPAFKANMNAATGTAVCACLVALGVLILMESNRKLKALSFRKAEETK